MEQRDDGITPANVLRAVMEKWETNSVDELALKIGIPARSLYRWQSGKHKPNFVSTIELLERASVLRWGPLESDNPDDMGRYLEYLTYQYNELLWELQDRYDAFEKRLIGAFETLGGEYAEKAKEALTKSWEDRRYSPGGAPEGMVDPTDGAPPPTGILLSRLARLEEMVEGNAGTTGDSLARLEVAIEQLSVRLPRAGGQTR